MQLRVLYVTVALLAGANGLALDFYVFAGTLAVSPTDPVARSLPNMPA